ncbi:MULTISPECIES: helix-turn-helix domain-containing protein [unclassified Microbacterium]|uniref:AraC family transcriptional regulator n=1 Tax=unclassified Microbacterium TaxID=2609290 RepID=UPI000EA871FA|nr:MULTISPECIES: helix-turn-helix domain-containing protein [unclassified Microbacterium]MBT2485242.1 AraC family transcriptional regulator [Microbacterium sp. ISL-108]RKN68061.1 AraC family transcriptional regulator [Microbacterium sp. CGR2]
MENRTRGILYPARLPQLHRLVAPADVAELVRWFWIPEWDVEPGRSSRQEIIAYPALNLVVTAHEVTLSGATTRMSHRDLRGRGWAVGALLRPAAVPAFVEEPAALVDSQTPVDAPALREAVSTAMGSGEGHRDRAVLAVSRWLRDRVGRPSDTARQANGLFDVLMGEGAASTTEEAATRLAVSVRTLQRMTHRHVGVSPAAMIRRRRLQEAAELVRARSDADLATIAAALGYSDHAHLTRDFHAVLGITPRDYRSDAAADSAPGSGAGDPQPQHPVRDAEQHDDRADE